MRIVLIVPFLVAAVVLSACGVKKRVFGGGAAPSASEAASEPDAAEPGTTLLDTVVLSNFGRGGMVPALAEKLYAALERFAVSELYFELEGHTDSSGSHEVNERVGEQRASMVSDHLHEKYQVPFARISVVSYGEGQPAVPNDTPERRAQNRRVVVKILR